jgi:hypothetical protein
MEIPALKRLEFWAGQSETNNNDFSEIKPSFEPARYLSSMLFWKAFGSIELPENRPES